MALALEPAGQEAQEGIAFRGVDRRLAVLDRERDHRHAARLARRRIPLGGEREAELELRHLDAAGAGLAEQHHRRHAVAGEQRRLEIEPGIARWRLDRQAAIGPDRGLDAGLEAAGGGHPQRPGRQQRERVRGVEGRRLAHAQRQAGRAEARIDGEAEGPGLEDRRQAGRGDQRHLEVGLVDEALEPGQQLDAVEARRAPAEPVCEMLARIADQRDDSIEPQLAAPERRRGRIARNARLRHVVEHAREREGRHQRRRLALDPLDQQEIDQPRRQLRDRRLDMRALIGRQRSRDGRDGTADLADAGDHGADALDRLDAALDDGDRIVAVERRGQCRHGWSELPGRGRCRVERSGESAVADRTRWQANTERLEQPRRALGREMLLERLQRLAEQAGELLERAGFATHAPASTSTRASSSVTRRPGSASTSAR